MVMTVDMPTAAAEKVTSRTLGGGVKVDVYAHDLSLHGVATPMWTAITDGLAATLSQPELILTVRRCAQGGPVVPEALLAALAAMIGGLRGSSTSDSTPPLRPGTALTLPERSPPLLPGTELRALALFHAQPIDGIPIVGGSLAVVLMCRDEHAAAFGLGLIRWAARRGELERAFPTPLWTDPVHPPMLRTAEATESILGKLPHFYLVGTTVTQYRTPGAPHIVFTVDPEAAMELAEMVRRFEEGFAISTELSPRADACLVWRPGQTERVAISDGEGARGDRLGGNFLLLGLADGDELTMLEDGFVVTLRSATWAQLRAALQTGARIEVPLDNAVLIVEFIAEPLPRTVVAADPPPLELHESYSGRMLADVAILTLDSESGRAATPAALMAFFLALEEAAVGFDGDSNRRGPAAVVAVDFRLDPVKPPACRMQALGLADTTSYLDGLLDRIRRDLPLPRVLAPLMFRVVLRLPDTTS